MASPSTNYARAVNFGEPFYRDHRISVSLVARVWPLYIAAGLQTKSQSKYRDAATALTANQFDCF